MTRVRELVALIQSAEFLDYRRPRNDIGPLRSLACMQCNNQHSIRKSCHFKGQPTLAAVNRFQARANREADQTCDVVYRKFVHDAGLV